MPQLANITVNDGKATPASHTFKPWTIDNNGVARLKESSGVPIGDKTVALSLRESGSKLKGRLLMALPVAVTSTVNGVDSPVVARTAFADVTFTFEKTSSTQERADALAMMANLLSNGSVVKPTFVDLEGIY